jgi:hypothetical protein
LDAVNVQEPLPRREAAASVARCAAHTAPLLARRKTHLPKEHVGMRLSFADSTSARVFRETTVDRPPPTDPSVLVVAFRLRLLRGKWHRLFLWECILNTPLFVGFPGLVSKLWLDHDHLDRYRGFYEWDGAEAAEHYACALWRVLELVCPPDAIAYRVIPGFRRDDVLQRPELLGADATADPQDEWWRLVRVEGRAAGPATTA